MGSGSYLIEPVFHRIGSLRRHHATLSSRLRKPAYPATQRLGERLFHMTGENGLGTQFFLRIYDSHAMGMVAVMTEMDEETGWQLTYGAAEIIRTIAEKHHLDVDTTIWLDHSVARVTDPADPGKHHQVGEEHSFIQIIVKPDAQLYWEYLPTELVTQALGERVLNIQAFL